MAERKIAFDEEIIAGKAIVRYARVSPRKVRLIADLLRYKTVAEAEKILKFTPKPSSVPIIKKALDAAKASVDRHEFPGVEELVIGDIRIDGGPMLKRIRAQSRGRAVRYLKRTSHISISLMPPIE